MIALGNALRPQGIVVIAAFAVFSVLQMLPETQNRKFEIRFSIVCLLIAYLLLVEGLSWGIQLTGINKNGLRNTFPLYKFVIGLNDKTAGFYSAEDVNTLLPIKDKEIRNKKSLALISERLSDKGKVIELIRNKHEKMWVKMDDTIDWGFRYLEKGGVPIMGKHIPYDSFRTRILNFEKAFYLLAFFMAFLGIFTNIRKRNCTKDLIPVILIVLVNFAIYCLIEIQPRYRDFQMVFIFILAASGVEYTGQYLTKHFVDYKLPSPIRLKGSYDNKKADDNQNILDNEG
jgi:predicted membrane channel-forming protein YqfA (hemolysin III family)